MVDQIPVIPAAARRDLAPCSLLACSQVALCTGNSVGLLPPRSGGELLPAGVLNGPAFGRGPILLKKAFLFFYLRCARVVVVAVAV